MKEDYITELRHQSRKLIRELGMLQLDKAHSKGTPQHWHSLIEISKEPGITISKLGHLLLLSISATSRIINSLLKDKLVDFKYGVDKREKYLYLTEKGQNELKYIDKFSNTKIQGAFEFLTVDDQKQIIDAIQKYGNALEQSRLVREQIKILTLSTSRTIRKQIITLIEDIQKNEFLLPITDEINACILRAEEEFYYNNSYNFWYAVDKNGVVIGSIGLKKINYNTAEIKKFFVNKSYRGKGVAQKLMHTLTNAASKHHFHMLYLGTVDKLQAAHRFYEKYGFLKILKKQLPKEFIRCSLDTIFFKGENNKILQLLKSLEY